MAENIVLGVQLSGAEAALAQLTQLDQVLNHIKANRNVKITVNARSLNTAASNAEKLNTNLNQATSSAKTLGTTGTQNVNRTSQAIKGASKNAESFNTGMGNVVLTMAKFRLASSAINLVASGFKEAFAEMKRVDSEMVTIRKVTGFTADEMERLSKNAYSLASKYGRTASEVMSGESVFARAGYTEQIEQLSELNLLLQNVGDLQADDAAKFLIATDAAYKLGGSYDDLMAVVDGLNEITNKHATDMQKMTEGMTVAGSVFAESGESIETFAALLGTATANTQRSGSEMARGLRTILMNLRQIRVAMDENGEPIYAENIAAASKALQNFAGISTMSNGQLRKASDVLDDLASVWGTLGENEKAAIAEAVAGKRQANVLMALMGDWPTYQKMLADYASGAGSAMKENEIYLDSWDAKTKQIKASWTELVSNIADTDVIKGGLDLVASGLDGINSLFDTAEQRIEKLKGEASDAEKTALEERASYEQNFGAGSRYDQLLGKIGSLTEAEKIELGVLESQRQERERLLELAEEEARSRANAVAKEQEKQLGERNDTAAKNGKNLAQQIGLINDSFAQFKDVEAYANSLSRVVAEYGEYYNALLKTRDAGTDLTEQEQAFIEGYALIAKVVGEGGDAVDAYGKVTAAAARASGLEAEQAVETGNQAIDTISGIGEALDDLPSAKTIEINVSGNILSGTLSGIAQSMAAAFPKFASGTRGAPGGPALVNEHGPEMIAANGIAYIAGGGKPTVAMLPRGATVLTASQTKRATGGRGFGAIPAFDGGTGSLTTDIFGGIEKGIRGSTGSKYRVRYCPVCGTANPMGAPRCVACGYSFVTGKMPGATGSTASGYTGGGSYTGGASGPTPPDFKALEADLTKLLKNLDAQAELAENEEDYIKAMMVYGDAQAAIADLLEQYRANGYADDSDEVLRLANLGYDYAAKQLGGYDKLQEKLIDALNALTDSTDKANELQERREAVEKAREALANAEKQRTVRIFNPVTGQWEWVANAADVTKAQENLKNAEEALKKEEFSQAVDAIKNAKPGDLGNMALSPAILEALFGGTPEQQSAFLNALGAATGGADYLGSAEAKTAWNQGTSIGTQYNLAGITLTETQASGMTIKELIAKLQGLKVM